MLEPTVLIAFFAGLVSFLSPCVLPLVPAYVGYMSGRAVNSVRGVGVLYSEGGGAAVAAPAPGRALMLAHGAAFVAGFTLIFVTIGLLGTVFIAQIGRQNINLFTDAVARFGGLLIIFFGLHFMGVIPRAARGLLARESVIGSPLFTLAAAALAAALIAWAAADALLALLFVAVLAFMLTAFGAFTNPLAFWKAAFGRLLALMFSDTRRTMPVRGGGLLGSGLMGVIFAAGWTPCIGPIYGAILTMAAVTLDAGTATALLAAYSIGLGIPFLLAAVLFDRVRPLLRRVQRNLGRVELVTGAFLVVIGIAVTSGRLQDLSQRFAVDFADVSYRMEECVMRISEGEIGVGEFFACASTDDAPPPAQS
jgi:cytochrome c-type biogenesis protein